jgi:uncharacterized protein (DUF58 family)
MNLWFRKERSQQQTVSVDDGLIRISAQSLIALHHGAESLVLKPARIRSQQSGGYLSPFKGRGMEFDEVRPYMQGDDVRTLDWRVTARTGKPHTKLFREERERMVLLWADLRRPMFFATQGAYKSVRAAQAAALLGWSAIHHGDRLGALIFGEDEHLELRPKRGKHALLHLFKQLAGMPLWQRTQLNVDQPHSNAALHQSLLRLRRVAQPGSLIFLLSDFSDLDEQARSHIAQLSRHSDLVLISIHDPLESELPPPGRYRVSDGARFITVDSTLDAVRQQYHQRYQWRQAELQQFCRRHGLYLLPMSTADDPLTVLQRGLGGRP